MGSVRGTRTQRSILLVGRMGGKIQMCMLNHLKMQEIRMVQKHQGSPLKKWALKIPKAVRTGRPIQIQERVGIAMGGEMKMVMFGFQLDKEVTRMEDLTGMFSPQVVGIEMFGLQNLSK